VSLSYEFRLGGMVPRDQSIMPNRRFRRSLCLATYTSNWIHLELDIPTPGPGQIQVKTEACGKRHTDFPATHGDRLVMSSRRGSIHDETAE
jgi:hypothetical protein